MHISLSGHNTLSALQKYLEVLDEEMEVCDRYTQILKEITAIPGSNPGPET